jgi:hypothetical protein
MCCNVLKLVDRQKLKMKRLKDIEIHLECFEARYERERKIEAIRQKDRLWRIVIRLNVGIIAILCAVYAIYVHFELGNRLEA